MSDLQKNLERVRAGYQEEKDFHRFLIDAYTGGGGFQGRIKHDDSPFDGSHACYGGTKTESYLDQYPREDEKKFKQRINVSYYINHVQPLTDLKLAFMLAKPFAAENLPKEIEEWRSNVDGEGLTFDHARIRAATRAAILGYCPTIVDMPVVPEGMKTKAQAQDAGVASPRLVMLWPANLTEWQVKAGKLSWLKVRTDHAEREAFDAEERKFARYDVWTGEACTTYETDEGKEPIEKRVTKNTSGRVPLTVCKHAESEGDLIKGRPMHGDVSLVARRLFNLSSELDENLRSHAFPILVLAEGIDDADDEDKGDKKRVIGSSNGLVLDKMATQRHYYMGPPANIADSIEKRAAELIREMYRMARTEHVRPAGVADATGIARRYAFAATNAAIAAFALLVALWEQEVYVLVGRALGLSEDKLQAIRVVPPKEFDIEDIASAIKETMDALGLGLGPEATKTLKRRLLAALLPNADKDTMKQIEQELEDEAVRSAADAAFDASGEDDPEDDEDEELDEDGVNDGQAPDGGRPDRPAGAAGRAQSGNRANGPRGRGNRRGVGTRS